MGKKDTQRIIKITRLVIGGIFALFVLINGFHFSSLFIAVAAFLMFPFEFTEKFLNQKNIKSTVAIVLSVAFLCVGAITAPTASDNKNRQQGSLSESYESDGKVSNTSDAKSSTSSSKQSGTTSEIGAEGENFSDELNESQKETGKQSSEENTIVVYVTASGSKYHYKSNCSNMKTPKEITLEEAERQGYSPCAKCC